LGGVKKKHGVARTGLTIRVTNSNTVRGPRREKGDRTATLHAHKDQIQEKTSLGLAEKETRERLEQKEKVKDTYAGSVKAPNYVIHQRMENRKWLFRREESDLRKGERREGLRGTVHLCSTLPEKGVYPVAEFNTFPES